MIKAIIDSKNSAQSEIQEAFSDVHDRISKAMVTALEEVGAVAEKYAKAECPVDTGKLKNSIEYVIDRASTSVSVGTNVDYAA